MFDVGFSELVVIGLVALLVLGPKRLPEVARAAGRWLARIRRFVADVRSDFDKQMHDAELAELRKLKDELDETRRVIQQGADRWEMDFSGASALTTPNPLHNPALDNNKIAPPETPRGPVKRKSPQTKKSRRVKRHGQSGKRK
jgi:sec-independent protein translocase protein TatB